MPVVMSPEGFFGRIPLAPHQMQAPVTPTRDMIVLCHLGVPQLTEDAHRLEIAGLVERPLSLSLGDLRALPQVEVESVHQCAGSPLQPQVPTRRISNVRWGGVRLSEVLHQAGPQRDARFIWSTGADHGVFADVRVASYVKDLPLDAMGPDVLLATHVNGEPLPREHGFPLRLVAPGFFGTNSVKWLTRIELHAQRHAGPFTTRWYNDAVRDAAGQDTGQTTPVWQLAPEAVIVSPQPAQVLDRSETSVIEGWAWAHGGVARVEVSVDDGVSWRVAAIEMADGYRWQKFSCPWIPQASGRHTIIVRAIAVGGATQPRAGARNAWHTVDVKVAG